MTRDFKSFIYIKGDKHRLCFRKIEPYVLEMSGFAEGSIHVGSFRDGEETNFNRNGDGPYLYRGLDVKILGHKGVISHFDITKEVGKVKIHLRQ